MAPWTVFAMNWSMRLDKRWRLAIGSFIEDYTNKVSHSAGKMATNPLRYFTGSDSTTGRRSRRADAQSHVRPSLPHHQDNVDPRPYPDLLATSGDYLRLWRVGNGEVHQECMLNNVSSSHSMKTASCTFDSGRV